MHFHLPKTFFAAVFLLIRPAMASQSMSNDHIREQVETTAWRVLPRGENYSLAADLHAFWNVNNGAGDYYHSGFWANGFVEYKPDPQVTMNLKLSIFNPSNSYGYNSGARIVPFFAATWAPPPVLGMQFALRGLDLGRVTIGSGLLAEEKEMSGLQASLGNDVFNLVLIKPGTSVYEISGDANILKASAFHDLVALTYFDTVANCRKFSAYGRECVGSDVTGVTETRQWDTQFWSLSSRHSFPLGVGYGAEIARRGEASAYLGRIHVSVANRFATILAEFGYRAHERDFWRPFVRHIDQDYVSFEDREKRYGTIMNFLSFGNPKSSSDAILSVEFFKESPVRVSLRNEFGRVHFFDRNPLNYFMYDNGFSYCPLSNPNACGKFSYSNMVVNARGSGADVLKFGPEPILITKKHARVEATFQL
jgi:hypothetical protein